MNEWIDLWIHHQQDTALNARNKKSNLNCKQPIESFKFSLVMGNEPAN